MALVGEAMDSGMSASDFFIVVGGMSGRDGELRKWRKGKSMPRNSDVGT
jgi:hypothetical protein